jgi:hypothetical protein
VAVAPFIMNAEPAFPLMVPAPPQTKFPLAAMVIVFPFKFNAPEVRVNMPLIFGDTFKITPLALFIVRLFTCAAPDGIVTPAEPPPNTRFDVEVVERLAGVPEIAGPFKVSVLAPTAKVPAASVNVPETVMFPAAVLIPLAFPVVRLL